MARSDVWQLITAGPSLFQIQSALFVDSDVPGQRVRELTFTFDGKKTPFEIRSVGRSGYDCVTQWWRITGFIPNPRKKTFTGPAYMEITFSYDARTRKGEMLRGTGKCC